MVLQSWITSGKLKFISIKINVLLNSSILKRKKKTNETIGIKVCFKMQLVKMNSAVGNERKTWHHSNYKLKD